MGNLWENPSHNSLGRWVTPSIPAGSCRFCCEEHRVCNWDPVWELATQPHWNPDSVFCSVCAPRLHPWHVPELTCEPWAGALCLSLSLLRNGYCSCITSYHSIPVCSLAVEPGWEPDLCKAGCLFMQTFSFPYLYPEVLLSTSRVAQPIILIAADILGRKILPKILWASVASRCDWRNEMEVMKGRMKNCYLQSSVKSQRCLSWRRRTKNSDNSNRFNGFYWALASF